MKTPFISAKELETITDTYPTPFHLYDERAFVKKRVLSIRHLLGIRDLKSILPLKLPQHLRF